MNAQNLFQSLLLVVFVIFQALAVASISEDKVLVGILGENLSLVCDTKSETIVWTVDGKNLTKNSNKRITWEVKQVDETRDDGYVFQQWLSIAKLETKDAGNYSCVDAGTVHRTYFVQPILEPKIIKKSPRTMHTKIDGDVTIFCYIEAYPVEELKSTVFWSKEDVDGKEYTSESDSNLNNKTAIAVVNQRHLNVTLEMRVVAKKDNGTYFCNIENPKTGERVSGETALLVLDVPQVRIEYVKAVGMDKIYMNWTVNDGNSNVTYYRLQYLKEGNSTFTYYNNKINGNATSHVIKGFKPSTNYKLKLQAINKIGDGSPYQYSDFVKTLDKDPDFVPEIDVKGSTHTTITIGWQPPPADILEYIHYYELVVERPGNEPPLIEETIHPQNSRNLPYMFDNLKAATEYRFKVRACSELTKLCGNWSVPVNGSTMDGAPSRPLNLQVTCLHANISTRSSVKMTWDEPELANGQITVYQTVLTGIATYRMPNQSYHNETFGPKIRYEAKARRTVYAAVPANTNYTVQVSAITRNKQRPGAVAEAHCQMPAAVPDQKLGKFLWGRVKSESQYVFRLQLPRISERNGAICCYLIYMVRLPKDSQKLLPYPDQLEVMTYQQVHHPNNTVGGAYIAEILDGDDFIADIYLGEGRMPKRVAPVTTFDHAIADSALFRKCLLLREGRYHWWGRQRVRHPTTSTSTTTASPTTTGIIQPAVLLDVGHPDESTASVISDPVEITAVPPQAATARRRRRRQHLENLVPEEFHSSAPSYEVEDGPLDMNSDYTGFVEVIVFSETSASIMNTFSDYFDKLTPGEPPNAGEKLDPIYILDFVVHILLALIVLLVLLLLALCLVRRYHMKKIARMSNDGDEEISLRDSLRALCGGRSNSHHHHHQHRHLVGGQQAAASKPPDIAPIPRAEMQQAFVSRHKDSDYGFQQEFEMLPDRFSDRTTKFSDAKENGPKNRYPDIKAYDQTRVKLSTTTGQNGCVTGGGASSDYINANFVIGYKERKKFICAQGPMEGTVTDFWRMVWEQHLEIMVMLTNLEEYNKTKCAKYWPEKINDTQQFGEISVKFVNEERFSDYLIRELRIVKKGGGHHNNNSNNSNKNNNSNTNNATENGNLMSSSVAETANEQPATTSESRLITQYHYLVWKDFMAPEHPQGITKFIKQINAVYSVQRGPILVHCSAGVGRTGTLVALDSLLQQLEEEQQVSIFNTVCDLRHQRNFLVQSLKQYIFLYRALMEVAVFGSTEILARNLSATVEALKQKLSNDDDGSGGGGAKCQLELQFERIRNSIDDQIGPKKTTAQGAAPENAAKNRDEAVLPYDRNRAILAPIAARDNATYINASFIEGNDHTETFIITQDPIADVTVADLWRLISEQSISTLVMISEIGDGPKRCPRYWADDEVQYDHIVVKYIQSESCPYYTRREFKVTNCKIDDTIQVTQFQYNGWPTVEGQVPEVCRGIIELVDQATKHHANVHQMYTNSGPIAVHCNTGTDRSSIFVAMCFLVQQLRVEKKVDVCSIVRKLRSQRLGMIDTYAQYEFLHRAIVNYADLHKLSTDSPVSHSE